MVTSNKAFAPRTKMHKGDYRKLGRKEEREGQPKAVSGIQRKVY